MPRDEQPYAGSSITFTCPIDDLLLATTQPLLVGEVTRESASVGGHLHVEVGELVSCANGHRWRLHGDLLLERGRD